MCWCLFCVWAFLRRHKRVGEFPEGKTSFQGRGCRYYSYKSDLPHRWEQQIVHTPMQRHTLADSIEYEKVLLPISADTAPMLQFRLCESSFRSFCLVHLVCALCAYACMCVDGYVVVCPGQCVWTFLGTCVFYVHWFGLFAQLGKQIVLYLDRDVRCSNSGNCLSFDTFCLCCHLQSIYRGSQKPMMHF